MRADGIVGEIDDQHKIHAQAPRDLPPGRVQLIVVRPDEDAAGAFWPRDVSLAWSDELGDVRQDLHSLADGQPVDPSRRDLPREFPVWRYRGDETAAGASAGGAGWDQSPG
jgi:hypothetical protein